MRGLSPKTGPRFFETTPTPNSTRSFVNTTWTNSTLRAYVYQRFGTLGKKKHVTLPDKDGRSSRVTVNPQLNGFKELEFKVRRGGCRGSRLNHTFSTDPHVSGENTELVEKLVQE